MTTEGKLTSTRGWRAALGALTAAAAAFAAAAVTYQLALASIPAHRATLENLVRARTGLDVRFDQLGLRWGWYGPEAVFSRVELREPGEPNVLVRAAGLTVGVDAWHTLQSGQLEAGRITLVAPDIDIARLDVRPHPFPARLGAPSRAGSWSAAQLLARWPNGRMDIEGGTLRLPDPGGKDGTLALPIRRATLHRADDAWTAEARALLPERFGRELKLSVRLHADPLDAASIAGAVHIEGEHLVLASWRELLGGRWSAAERLPSAGQAAIVGDLQLRAGRLEGGHGSLRAQDVIVEPGAPGLAPREIHLASMRGAWHLSRAAGIWHLTARDVALGALAPGQSPGELALEGAESGGWLRATLRRIPIECGLDEGWRGVSPELEAVRASLRELTLDWSDARAPDARLRVMASLDDVELGARGTGAALENMTAHVSGTDTGLLVAVEGPRGKLVLSGVLRPRASARVPVLDLHATLTDADVSTLQRLLGDEARRVLGPRAAHLSAGTITQADFIWTTSPHAVQDVRASSGSAMLRGATLEADRDWPAIENLDAHLEWRGNDWRASIERARAGPFQFLGLSASGRRGETGGLRLSGQAEAHLEDVFEWLRTQPRLDAYQLAHASFAAQGHAIFAFDAQIPRGGSIRGDTPRMRITTQLDGAAITLARELPPLENVRGTLTFDAGRLQRSLLTAAWLGGPVTLRVGEHHTGADQQLLVQAQGTLDARELAAVGATDLGTLDVAGRTAWRGELALTQPSGSRPASWRARADTALVGIISRLPAPLAKPGSTAAPLHVEVDGAGDRAMLRVSLGDTLRGIIALREAPQGWRPTGGDLRFGAVAPVNVPEGRIDVLGHLARADLAPWIVVWRGFSSSAMALPVRSRLMIDQLELASHSYRAVAISAEPRDEALELTLDGAALQGSLSWPAHPAPESPVEARFESLQMPPFGAAVDFAPLLAALEPVARLEVRRMLQGDHELGSLSTRLELEQRALTLDPLTLAGPSHELRAALHCSEPAPCSLRFALQTHDAATTLREFGLRADLHAQSGRLTGELAWPLAAAQSSSRQWLGAVRGRMALALTDGAADAANDAAGAPFALVAVPELLRNEDHALRFTSLAAEFDIHDGSAYTSDLHFDGDAEILMSGRVGLADQDYDYHALILRGEERLPAAVRHFAAAPKVAAAWMALRELIGGGDPDPSRLQLRLEGSWQSPTITAAR